MRTPRGPRPPLIQLTERQRALVEEMAAGRRRPHDEVQRAAIIRQRADGARTRPLAQAFGGSAPTIRLWRARWVQATPQLAAADVEAAEDTLGSLIPPVWHEAPRRGRPAPCTPAHRGPIVAVACEAPAEAGRPVPHGTPREVAPAVSTRGRVPSISPRHVGRFCKRRGLHTSAGAVWAQS
jgi:putative transposase